MARPLRTHAQRTRASRRYPAVLLLIESATLLTAVWTSVSAPLRSRLLVQLLAGGVALAQLETGGPTLTCVLVSPLPARVRRAD